MRRFGLALLRLRLGNRLLKAAPQLAEQVKIIADPGAKAEQLEMRIGDSETAAGGAEGIG